MAGIEFETPSPALPGYVNRAIEEIFHHIQCAQIAPDSRRARAKQEALDSLRIVRSALESLSQAERFEREEKARARLVELHTIKLPTQQKRSA